MSKEKRYFVPLEIEQLRAKLCDDFVSTGNLDETILARLHIFADEVRGKPRVELPPEAMTKRLIEFVRPQRATKRKLVPRIGKNLSLRKQALSPDDGRFKNIGRQKGSRILIVNGARKLVPMLEIENAIRNGARYPVQIPAQPKAAAGSDRERKSVSGNGDDGGGVHCAEHGEAEG